MSDEIWNTITEFPTYSISNRGNVHNQHFDRPQKVYPNNYGHMRVTLTDHDTGERYDRSVVKLVAEAFCEPPNSDCNRIVVLDGDYTHTDAENLVWRPGWYAWKYVRQLKTTQPIHYHNLRVRCVTTLREYPSVIQAGIAEGLLFDDIWRSTYTKAELYPYGHVFEICESV